MQLESTKSNIYRKCYGHDSEQKLDEIKVQN